MLGLIFTYVMTYGGAAASLINPRIGLLIYICFAIVKPPALWHWSVPMGNYSRIIAIAFLFGWALHGFGDRWLGKAKPIVGCLLGYWFWVTLSTVFSPQPELGWPFVIYMAKIVLPFVAGLTLITTERRLQALVWVIIGSCGYLAYEINMAFYFSGLNLSIGKFISLDNNSISILIVTGYGMTLVYGMQDPVFWRRCFLFGLAAVMAHVPLLGMSRGGMLGILFATSAAFVIAPKTPRVLWLAILVVIGGSILAGPSVVEEFSTILVNTESRDASAQSRVDLWVDCTETMLQNPLVGIGPDRWPEVAADFGWPEGKEAHSLWFQTAAELGVPGVLFLFMFYVITIRQSFRVARYDSSAVLSLAAASTIPAIIGFAVSAAFVTVEAFELPFYVVLVAAIAVKLSAEGLESDDLNESNDLVTEDLNVFKATAL